MKKITVTAAAVVATAVASVVETDIYLFLGIYCAGAASALAAIIIAEDFDNAEDGNEKK